MANSRFRCLTFIAPSLLLLWLQVQFPATSSISTEARASGAVSFNFLSFDNSSSLSLIDARGSARFAAPVLELTPGRPGNGPYNTGRATYRRPMRLWDQATGKMADFTVRFSFSIDSMGNASYGDGLAFFLAPEGSFAVPSYSDGSFLGLARDPDRKTRDYTSFVAVEIDTNHNPSLDAWDPNCDHIGVDVDDVSSTKNLCVPWLREMIMTGGRANATITYRSGDQVLRVVLTDLSNPSNSSALDFNVNLSLYLPEMVTFGFSATTGPSFESHTIHSWEMNSTLLEGSREGRKLSLVVGICSAIAVTLCLVVAAFLCFVCRSTKRWNGAKVDGLSANDSNLENIVIGPAPPPRTTSQSPELDRLGSQVGPKEYTYEALEEATSHFDEEKKLGKGGFGDVYKGIFGDSEEVAIKKIKRHSGEDQIRDYARELKIISGLSHRNLVKLLGWCHEKADEYLFLVYEFMPKLSLDHHLFGNNKPVLPWNKRYNIAKGLASALAYLHGDKVIHRDIKCSNVMLDSEFNPKLGDFGTVKVLDEKSTRMVGTYGYLAPEYWHTGKPSEKSDMYSFGLVLLEIACGKKVRGPFVYSLVRLHTSGRLLEAADARLGEKYDNEQAKRVMIVGICCSLPDMDLRPTIEWAAIYLRPESDLSQLVKSCLEPAIRNGLLVSSIGRSLSMEEPAEEEGKREDGAGSLAVATTTTIYEDARSSFTFSSIPRKVVKFLGV
ncbi:hypothetical protein MLD38_026714 [Melastoma candidum]|uniref:Uncharacterized protein n=1 Tax=Melastoma candidum TaxID=119954 RepID=A0ACB9NZY1_9MYRT|nr:hypothetical protein MLD38_026714 [Melastoma candidum]